MKYSKKFIFPILLIICFILPAIIYRIYNEQQSKSYSVAINMNQISKLYKTTDIEQIVKEYKKSGATTAIIQEKNGMYSEKFLNIAKKLDMTIALVPDITNQSDADINEIIKKYNVRYIKLKVDNDINNRKNFFAIKEIYNILKKNEFEIDTNFTDESQLNISLFLKRYEIKYTKFKRSVDNGKASSVIKSKIIYDVIRENNLNVVLSETIMQLSNEHPFNYKNYLYASDGNVIRSLETYKNTNIKEMNYNELYYQMYNSAYDRNVRFISVNQLTDEKFSIEENAIRTQNSIRLFCTKMEKNGFIKDGKFNYKNYTPNRRFIFSIVAIISFYMIYNILNKNTKFFKKCLIISIPLIIFITLFIPEKLLVYYPTIFAAIAPSFCLICSLRFIENNYKKYSFIKLCLYSSLISLLFFMVCGTIIMSMLSGADYLLNESFFYGVKLTLILPIIFVILLIIKNEYNEIKNKGYNLLSKKELIRLFIKFIKQIKWYHILIVSIIFITGAIYVIRSGNVSSISFFEIKFRNYLTEIFSARPRTKEIVIGWPCFIIYIYYKKHNLPKLLQYVLLLGTSILFASVMNTFCHVFTMTFTMYLRVLYGLLLGGIVSVFALVINYIFIKILNYFIQKNNNAKEI